MSKRRNVKPQQKQIKKTPKISIGDCRFRLAKLWLTMFALILLLLIFQHVCGKYDYKVRTEVAEDQWELKTKSQAGKAWELFLPLILPSFTLMITALGYEIWRRSEKNSRGRTVELRTFRIFFSLSLIYLIALCLVILLNPFSRHSQLELMRQYKAMLIPFQGVVDTSLGVFFTVKKETLKKLLSFKKKKRRRK